MDLRAGDRIILQVSTFEDRFLGEVSLVKHDDQVLVSAMVPDVVIARVKEHDHALLRYAYDGRLLGYDARIVSVFHSGETIFELITLGDTFDAEDRKEPRCACSFPAVVNCNGEPIAGLVEDISASCVRVRLSSTGDMEFPEAGGRKVGLTFYPSGGREEVYSVQCMVVKSFLKEEVPYMVLRYALDEPDALKRISGLVEAQVCCLLPQRSF